MACDNVAEAITSLHVLLLACHLPRYVSKRRLGREGVGGILWTSFKGWEWAVWIVDCHGRSSKSPASHAL